MLLVSLLVDVVEDELGDGTEELVLEVAALTFEMLEDPDTEGFIAGKPALSPGAVPGAAPPRNGEVDIITANAD